MYCRSKADELCKREHHQQHLNVQNLLEKFIASTNFKTFSINHFASLHDITYPSCDTNRLISWNFFRLHSSGCATSLEKRGAYSI